MSVETRSATLSSLSRSNIDPTRKAVEPSSVEPISFHSASTSPTDTREPYQASLKTRTVTKESLADDEDAALFEGIDGPDQIISSQYYRITPPPPSQQGRESPLLFAASFDQGDYWQPPVVTPLPTVMSQPPPKEVKSMPPGPPIVSKAPPTAAGSSLIHRPPTISVPRTHLKSPPSMDSPTSENTGRWTAEEHRLFLQGLEEHGKGWKKIASLIQTRTVVQIRTHAQKYFQKLAKARANGEEEEKIVVSSSASAVPMRTVPGNMSLGTDSVSLAAAAGQVGTGTLPLPKRSRRNNAGGTKRRAIGSVVRSSVREGRTYKRQKMLEEKRNSGGERKLSLSDVPNPLPSISSILDPYVMAPPVLGVQPMEVEGDGKTRKSRGRQQLVNTATHGTLPMAALEDAVFRLLTPAPGATGHSSAHAQPPHNPSIVDPLAPNPVKISATYPPAAAASVSTTSPTCVTDMSGFPSWVDAKNPPTWYNNGEDIDQLLEDADGLNWLVDTGDLEETYAPAVAATAAAAPHESTLDLEPTPVNIQPHEYAAYDPNHAYAVESMDHTLVNNPMTHPSVESLSFLVDSPKEGIDEMPTFLEEEHSEDGLPYSTSQTAIVEAPQGDLPDVESQHLMSFPDLDMGDEQAFVSALLDTSKESALSFSKWGSQNGVAELGDE